ncbi:UDP-glucuronic acid decarboxylase family protein [Inquilinus sp. CAU 1745]|uniref:UDP-glucuronic acid decarboxylase family protein n=1 Tax=Inquilinus sp. CAU 1745 TaxID=3140369 RepID=UPI00325AB129
MKNGRQSRILVAGGAGFIGSHLCDALLETGAQIICIDNFRTGRMENLDRHRNEPRLQTIHADVIEPLPTSVRPDWIFNLACAASPPHYQADPIHTMMTSVVGTRNLLALAADTGARFVQASTSEIYGDPEVHPQTERYFGNVNPTGPRACYDEGKRAAEALCFDYRRAGRADVRVARIFNTYGPRMRADDGRVISNVITQALSGRDITLYGDGQQTRSFCYVDDLVRGLKALMEYEGEAPGPVNLGNPTEITVADLVRRVLKATGSRSRCINLPLPADDPRRRKPDTSLARQLLNWSATVPLHVGLSRTVRWFQETMPERPPARAAIMGEKVRIAEAPVLQNGAATRLEASSPSI